MAEPFIPAAAPIHRRKLSRLETALAARRNVLEIIPALAYRQPIVSGKMLMRWHMLTDPSGLKHVLLDRLANYPKSEIMKRMLRPAIGNSLFNAEGPDWKWQRQAVAPVFSPRNVRALAPAMTATAERSCDRLAASGGRMEILHQMLTATFDVICDVALSGREHFDADTFSRAISGYFHTAGRASLLDFLGVPDWFPRPGHLLAASSVRTMHDMVATAIQARRAQSTPQADDLLSRMLEARDPETDLRMSLSELVLNMQFFIVAGHETTALALSWALYLLAHAPQEQKKACAQARAVLAGRAAGPDDLPGLTLIRRALEEAMQLYPPVGLLARTVMERDALCGRTIEQGDIVFLPIWALHRHELLWEQPERFLPERFGPGAAAGQDRYQYLPFGAGPRACVGAEFAMMQAQIILATLLQHFRFDPARPLPRPVMMMTVRPEPGIYLNVEQVF